MFDKFYFPKKVRLKKIPRQNTLAITHHLIGKYYVFYCYSNELRYARLGIITAKKKCRLAVERNRIKRQVREAFRVYKQKLSGYDIVVVARQMAREASKCELKQCLESLLLKLIKNVTA